MVRFFTRAWRTGAMSEDNASQVVDLYRRHLDGLRPPLPTEVRRLADTVNLHDALLTRLELDRRARTVHICFRAGDRQVGYFDIDLQYSGADLEPGAEATLRRALGRRDIELLDAELDSAGGAGWDHRFLFAPDGEASLTFSELKWARVDRASRHDYTAA
jgi:hypothetical protein